MRHLLLVVVALDAAADGADAPRRGQLPLDELALGMEEHEVDPPAVVLAGDLVGRPRVAARRRLVLEHPHLEGGDGAGHGLGDGRRGAAVDDAGRRVPEEVDDARLADARRQPQRLLQQDLHARADAGKALGGGKEGYQLVGPHMIGVRPLAWSCASVVRGSDPSPRRFGKSAMFEARGLTPKGRFSLLARGPISGARAGRWRRRPLPSSARAWISKPNFMTDDAETRRRRAVYRACHRGTKEMDWILGRFAGRAAAMPLASLGLFERMLSLPDPDLQDMILHPEFAPAGEYAELVAAVRVFHGLESDH